MDTELIVIVIVISFGSYFIGLAIGYYYGKRNYKWQSKDKHLIEIEVDTEVAQARIALTEKKYCTIERRNSQNT